MGDTAIERAAAAPAKSPVTFEVDLQRGVVIVGVCPALSLESARAKAPMSVLEFLDLAAKITLELNAQQRQEMAQLRNGVKPQ
jgi:hypothetical protein